jgi:hypothetical protein
MGSERAASFTEFTSPVLFGINPAAAGLKEESSHAQDYFGFERIGGVREPEDLLSYRFACKRSEAMNRLSSYKSDGPLIKGSGLLHV